MFSEARARGIPPEKIQALLNDLRVRPTITAHPTEGKRVTVLEKFRRIYLVLRELEMPRWTDRERNGLMNELRDQIELVWMTGELHLEKATVEREVAWGLHFFDESLFEMLPETMDSLEESLSEAYPDATFKVPPFFQFGSWIGGDRDGNPFVTAAVTRTTLQRNALASLTRYRDGVRELGRTLSLTERTLAVPTAFREALSRQLAESGQARAIERRNPGEAYRQYLSCVLRKIEATIARNEGRHPSGPDYPSADGLIETCGCWSAALPRHNAAHWPAISCGRCGGWWRSSASRRCASTCARTPPAPPTRCAPCGARRTATASRPPSIQRLGVPGSMPASPGRATPSGPSRTCPTRRARRSPPSPWWRDAREPRP